MRFVSSAILVLCLTTCSNVSDLDPQERAVNTCEQSKMLQASYTLKWGVMDAAYVPPPLPKEVYEACNPSSDE